MAEEKETLKQKVTRFEEWLEEIDKQNQVNFEELKLVLKRKPSEDDSCADVRLAVQQTVARATEDSVRIDNESRERLRKVKRAF
ncbi:MAG: hypothetical protein AB1793_04605 [Candidatus Thermoplasmatota archaeon]